MIKANALIVLFHLTTSTYALIQPELREALLNSTEKFFLSETWRYTKVVFAVHLRMTKILIFLLETL